MDKQVSVQRFNAGEFPISYALRFIQNVRNGIRDMKNPSTVNTFLSRNSNENAVIETEEDLAIAYFEYSSRVGALGGIPITKEEFTSLSNISVRRKRFTDLMVDLGIELELKDDFTGDSE